MIIKKLRFLALCFQKKKEECVTWYNETKFFTQTQQNYHEKHQRVPPTRNAILRWVQNFQDRGTVKFQSRSVRPSMKSEDEQRVSSCFSRQYKTSLRIA